MNFANLLAIIGVLCVLWGFVPGYTQETADLSAFSGVRDVKISAQWFVSYENGQFRGGDINRFILNRGYLSVQKKLNRNFVARITSDVSVDEEGDGRGDIEMRIKYLYLRYKLPSLGWITQPYVETGIIHRPWLSFEQRINRYRVQGTMYLDRVRILSSADYGISFFGHLGGELDEAYQQRVNASHAGRLGSVAIGIHNGGGYHAIEENNNKTIETRLSVRPLPDVLPGLQVSYGGGYGKGNDPSEPIWNLNVGMLSYETRYFTFAGQAFTGRGNSYGSLVDENGESVKNSGYSFFGEIKVPTSNFSLFSRYDSWDAELPEAKTFRLIAGMAYNLNPNSKLVLNVDYYDDEKKQKDPLTTLLKMDLEVRF